MPTLLPEPWETQFLTFLFVYMRVNGLIFSVPVLSNDSVLGPVKTGLAFFVSIILIAPLIGLQEPADGLLTPVVRSDYQHFIAIVLALAGEFAIGFAIGFIGTMIVQTMGLAGEVIGQQAGFSAASVFDPVTGQDTFLMAQVQTLFGTMIFIVVGGPEIALRILANSFQLVPPGAGFSMPAWAAAAYETLIVSESGSSTLVRMMYDVAVRIAAPIMAAMFLTSLSEAFLARTAPQLNILVVGFAIRIGIGLTVLWVGFPMAIMSYRDFIGRFESIAVTFLERMASFAG